MYCSRRLYKGESYEICLPITDSGVTTVKFYTRGDVIIEKEPETNADGMCFSFTEEEIAALPDGVLRYSYDDTDTNTDYVIATPGDYSGSTLDDMLEDAYESGLTSCSGSSCNIQPDKGLNLTELTWEYTGGGGPIPTNYGFYHLQNWMQEVSHDSGYDGMDKFVLYGTFQPKDAYDAAYSGGYDYGFQRGQQQLIDNMRGLLVERNNLQLRITEPSGDGTPEHPYVEGRMWLEGQFSGITYSGGSGYSHVDVGVHVKDIYESGFTSGQTQVLDRIGDTAITSNGVYAPLVFTSGDTVGWSSVTVNVPQTGYTQADLDAAFASGKTAGYDSGWTAGYDSGLTMGCNYYITGTTNLPPAAPGITSYDYIVPQTGGTYQITLDTNYPCGCYVSYDDTYISSDTPSLQQLFSGDTITIQVKPNNTGIAQYTSVDFVEYHDTGLAEVWYNNIFIPRE